MPQQSYEPYNPLDKSNLGTSVADALLARPVVNLPPEPFLGAGVYAIYYAGSFAPYQQIARSNRDGSYVVPIYVGKAVPAGARKGGYGLDSNPSEASPQTDEACVVLLRRLRRTPVAARSAAVKPRL